MDSWCFVHAADLHLDTPFEGIGRVDDHLARRLRDASLAAFDGLVELALTRRAAFVVLAGDVYDGPERGLRAQLRVEAGLSRLADHGIATFVAHGNHDPVATGWQLVTSWPDQVRVFGTQVEAVAVRRGDRVLAVVEGVSYAERAESRNLARLFGRTDHDALHVGVLHTNVGGDPAHAPYAPCSVDDLRMGGMDYWALGHIHARRVVLDGSDGGPWAVYPGNLQGRSVRVTERGEKGASVVHVTDGRVERVEPVVLDRARFDVVTTSIDDDTTLGDVTAALTRAVASAVERVGDRILVLRADVTGTGPAHVELARPGARDDLLDAIRDRATAFDDVVVTGFDDRTAPPTDELDPRLTALLDRLPDAEVVDGGVAVARERGWTDALPDRAALAAAARTAARSQLTGPT